MPPEPSGPQGAATTRDLSTRAPIRSAAGPVQTASAAARSQPPHEHGHLAQHRALALVQQVPGPVDDRAQGLLAGQDRAASGGEQAEAVVEPVGDLPRGQQPEPGGGQLDGERQPVQAAADLRHGLGVGEHRIGVGTDGLGALGEQPVRLLRDQGLDRAHRLTGDAQGFTAGREDREPRAVGEEGLGEGGCRADDVFAVVKDQEPAARGAVLDQQGDGVGLRGRQLVGQQHGLAQTEGADHRAGHRLRMVERGQLDHPRLRKPCGGLLGEAGLSRAARSGERDQAGPVQVGTNGLEFRFPPDEGGQTGAEIAGALGALGRLLAAPPTPPTASTAWTAGMARASPASATTRAGP